MQTAADHPEAPTAIRHDLGAIFISLELTRIMQRFGGYDEADGVIA
jgi:hypothetical protein